jgi:hypothetical protein
MATQFFDSDCGVFASTDQIMVPADEQEHRHNLVRSDAIGFSFVKRDTMRVLTQTVNDFVVDRLAKIPEVNCVRTDQSGEVFYVWIVMAGADDDEALDRVLDAEQGIMHEFREITFDFSVLFQMGRNVEELIGSASPLFKRS